MIKVNARILNRPTTGVQRYLQSIMAARSHSVNVEKISPAGYFNGHLWEQLISFELNKGDVLWSPSNTGPLYCANPHILTMHDFATLDHPEWTSRKFSTFYRFLLPRLATRCDGIIAISEYTKSRILYHSNIPPEKVTVIKNGVAPSFFKPATTGGGAALRDKYGIPHGRFVLSVSSIEPRKNLGRLLNAWKSICDLIDDDIHLVLVGRANPRIFSDAGLSDIPPRVIFTGFVDDHDLPNIYQHAYLFAYVSLYEGFGLPPLEAMAAGVAVLTSNSTSIPEVVADKAITVDPYSVADIADGLLLLLKNDSLRLRFAQAGFEHAQLFSWRNTASQTFDYIGSFA
ncbi:glycosyltransferase family 4 protein [Aeromonas veronii]